MKYIKTFENSSELKIGDWVYCEEKYTDNKAIERFISKHIGKCIKKSREKVNILLSMIMKM